MSRKRIFIDAGHGGHDPGAVGNGMRESDIALEVSNALSGLLKSAGVETILSRTSDRAVTINERWQAANAQRADYFISIHVNAGGGTGAETFIAATKPQDREFASVVNDTYAEAMGLRNRGVKLDSTTRHGSLGVLRHTTMPAILVELAFIDSPPGNPDVNILRDRRQEMAEALAAGVFRFLGIEQQDKEGDDDLRYQTIEELPDWAQPTIQKLMEQRHLQGDENGRLNLSEDMVRMLVINDRAGLYG